MTANGERVVPDLKAENGKFLQIAAVVDLPLQYSTRRQRRRAIKPRYLIYASRAVQCS